MKKLLITLIIGSFALVANAADKKAKEEVTAKGSVVCAHCDLSLKNSCQKAIKAEDGKVFLLTGKEAKSFFKVKDNKKAKSVTAKGSAREVDGNTVLTVSSISKN